MFQRLGTAGIKEPGSGPGVYIVAGRSKTGEKGASMNTKRKHRPMGIRPGVSEVEREAMIEEVLESCSDRIQVG